MHFVHTSVTQTLARTHHVGRRTCVSTITHLLFSYVACDTQARPRKPQRAVQTANDDEAARPRRLRINARTHGAMRSRNLRNDLLGTKHKQCNQLFVGALLFLLCISGWFPALRFRPALRSCTPMTVLVHQPFGSACARISPVKRANVRAL